MTPSKIPILQYQDLTGYDTANRLWYGSDQADWAQSSDWIRKTNEFPTFVIPNEPAASWREIADAIAHSRVILALADNWDEEGSVGYEESTLTRATEFLRNHATLALSEGCLPISAPMISPADKGSIDLYWRVLGRNLLINFPPNTSLASYYGEDANGDTIGGFISGDSVRQDLLAWLTKTS